ncbi:rhodanese-like domain-containing protein [Flavobacteriales bacterium]|nr:rhodanese-like domain-containing protein [Flavobacteriales bacterium]
MFFKKSNSECSPEDVKKAQQNPGAVIIDCRTPSEVAGGMVEGAEVLDWLGGGFKAKVPALDKSKTYYLYCRSGGRSGQAASFMRDQGFENVFNAGGYGGLKGL